MINRLRGGRVLLLAAALHILDSVSSSQAQAQEAADREAFNSYQLSMPRYKQYLNALMNLAGAAERDPKLVKMLKTSGQLSIDQSLKLYNGEPAARRAIEDAGVTIRDFVLTQGAALHAGMAHQFIKHGYMSADSAMKTGQVSQANLDFYRQNEAEIARLTKEYEAKLPASLRE